MAKGETQHIPQRPEEFTAAWFSDVLGRGTVSEVECKVIGTDIGFIGEVYRCGLTWAAGEGNTDDQPASVIVKVPTQNDENFALGDGLQLYEREIRVYRDLKATLGLPMPGYLHGAMDPDPAPWLERPLLFLFNKLPIRGINWVLSQFLKLAGKSKRRYVLVLEDITDARPPSQFEGGSLDDAHAALRVLAQFHAHNWMRTDAVAANKRIWALNRGSRVYQASYVRNREAFVERFGTTIGAENLARLDAIQDQVPEINDALAAVPWTLLHGDYRLDNLLFQANGAITVLDLQGLGYGRAGYDVTYFITTALTAEHRDEEQLLLRTYHDELTAQGITNYPWADLLRDARLTKEMLAHRIVGAADVLDTEMASQDDSLMDVLQLRVLDWLEEPKPD